MKNGILNVLLTIFIIIWPLLYMFIWDQLGYVWQRRKITAQTLFYVERSSLWKNLSQSVLYFVGIPMSFANAFVYAFSFSKCYGLSAASHKIMVIYLFIFAVCLNIFYSVLMLGRHCFTKEHKSKRFKALRGMCLFIVIFQLLFLDGILVGMSLLDSSFSLAVAFGRSGFVGYIVELLIPALFLFFGYVFSKGNRKSFFMRDFPR